MTSWRSRRKEGCVVFLGEGFLSFTQACEFHVSGKHYIYIYCIFMGSLSVGLGH